MKTKEQIVTNWLPRYTGTALEDFGKCILLVNFSNYVHMFAEMHGVPVCCEDKPMPNATADGITIITSGWGRPTLPLSWTCCLPSNPRPVCS